MKTFIRNLVQIAKLLRHENCLQTDGQTWPDRLLRQSQCDQLLFRSNDLTMSVCLSARLQKLFILIILGTISRSKDEGRLQNKFCPLGMQTISCDVIYFADQKINYVRHTVGKLVSLPTILHTKICSKVQP